jgi:hypothetical protein
MSLRTVSKRAGLTRTKASKWFVVPNLALAVPSATHILVLNIIEHATGVWSAAALVTPFVRGGSVQQVFDNHAHEAFGDFRTVKAAKRACEKYARAWLRKQPQRAQCACESIAKKRTS